MKSQARFTILMDRPARFSAVLLRLALGVAFIAAGIDCLRFRRAGGAVRMLPSFELSAVVVWLIIASGIIAGIALVVGFRIRVVSLTCGTLLLLPALAMIAVTDSSLSLTALLIASAAGAFALAGRNSHPWSLDYFLGGDWLPVYGLHR
jgi:uncharacterized membrane protein YphA (DoxX/SURF4 family)